MPARSTCAAAGWLNAATRATNNPIRRAQCIRGLFRRSKLKGEEPVFIWHWTRHLIEPLAFEDPPAPAVCRTFEGKQAHAVVGCVAPRIAGDDHFVARP